MEYCLIYVTFADFNEAKKIANILLSSKLIACANIFPETYAMYEWQGIIEEEKEVVAIFKTIDKNFEEVKNAILSKHSYDSPCILKLPITGGEKKFLKWIEKSF